MILLGTRELGRLRAIVWLAHRFKRSWRSRSHRIVVLRQQGAQRFSPILRVFRHHRSCPSKMSSFLFENQVFLAAFRVFRAQSGHYSRRCRVFWKRWAEFDFPTLLALSGGCNFFFRLAGDRTIIRPYYCCFSRGPPPTLRRVKWWMRCASHPPPPRKPPKISTFDSFSR